MKATNPSFCPPYSFLSPCVSSQSPTIPIDSASASTSNSEEQLFDFLFSVFGPLIIKSKKPTPELLCQRSLVGIGILEVLGVCSLVCRWIGRQDQKHFIDIMMDFLPGDKVKLSSLIYLFGRVLFRLDGVSVVDSISKSIMADIISVYLVAFATLYASGKSLKKILKLVIVSNCCLGAELLFRFYCWEAEVVFMVLPLMFGLHFWLDLKAVAEARS